MRKTLYTDLITQLKKIGVTIEVTTGDDVTTKVFNGTIQHFDIWNKQVEFMAKERPFKFPAVFIEFKPITWRELSAGVQEADIQVHLHLVHKTKASARDASADQSVALAYLDLPDAVNLCLHGWHTAYSGPFVRVQTLPNHDHEEMILETEVYQAKVTDMSAVRDMTEVEVTPRYNVTLHPRT